MSTEEQTYRLGINSKLDDIKRDQTEIKAMVSYTNGKVKKIALVGTANYDSNSSKGFTWLLVNPAAGTNTVSAYFSGGSGHTQGISTSYTGALQTVQPDSFATKSQGRAHIISVSPTTVAPLSWAYVASVGANVYVSPITVGYGVITRVGSLSASDGVVMGDSDGAVGSGLTLMGLDDTLSASMTGLVGLTIAPAPDTPHPILSLVRSFWIW